MQGSPGYIPPPIAPASGLAMAGGLAYQFRGRALYSIIAGLVSIGVPLFTTFYFPILPVFGILYAVQAFRRGQALGGGIGLALSILGGIMSLISSGLLFH
jgi:hypothetical protein